MIEAYTFIHNEWMWPAIVIGILLWSVFIWKEWVYPKTRTFYINVSIAFIAIVSMLMIALKPATFITDNTAKVVLLTPNYKEAQLDSLKDIYKGLVIQEYSETRSILNTVAIPETLFILGEGVRSYDLWELETIPVIYLGGNTPRGITKLAYTETETIGNSLRINGNYQNAQEGHQLVLTDPGGQGLDSLQLSGEEKQEFQLKTELKTKGKFVYALITKDTLGTIITKEPLPVQIKERQPLKIAIINEFPTFETKYLKNYLAEKGHEVLIRSQLTTSRYKYEYFNMSSNPEFRFTQEALTPFDLIIIDANSLRSLSRTRKKMLENAIRDDGLGLFIQSDSNLYTSSIPIMNMYFLQNKQQQVTLDEFPKTTINTYPYVIKNALTLTTTYNHDSGILAAYEYKGIGRVGVHVFQNTYELVLNGKTEEYQTLWTTLITGISKKKQPDVTWNSGSLWGYIHEPYNFKLRTQIPAPFIRTHKNNRIPLREDMIVAHLWEGTSYPNTLGWETHYIEKDSTYQRSYYVMDTIHWKSIKATETILANQRYFQNKNRIDEEVKKIRKPINSIWFFILFVLSMGYLWLWPKL